MAKTTTKKVEAAEKPVVKTASRDASAQIAALDKLAKTGGYNSAWTAAWNAYKEAAGL